MSDKKSCYDTDAAADCTAACEGSEMCSVDSPCIVSDSVDGTVASEAVVVFGGDDVLEFECTIPSEYPVRLALGPITFETELWSPLPNVLSGVRLVRDGSGVESPPDECSAAFDVLPLTV